MSLLPSELPQNIDAEMALIGAVLLDNGSYDIVRPILSASDFADPVHGRLWDAIGIEIEGGRNASPPSLRGFIATDPAIAERGGAHYLVRLVSVAAIPGTIADCGRAIRDASKARLLIASCEATAKEVRGRWSHGDIAAASVGLQDALDGTRDDITERRPSIVASDAAGLALSRLGEGKTVGVTSGLASLDRLIGGFRAGQMIVAAGATGMGKSSLALTCATAASLYGMAGMFSLEMTEPEIAERLLSIESNIPLWRIAQNRLDPHDQELLCEAQRRLTGMPLWLDCNRGMTVRDIRRRCLEWSRQDKLALIVVDYIQLLCGEGRADNRAAEVASITRALKVLAGDLNVPVLALSQLSRKVDNRDDKRPELGDLRESGSIEQDADMVLFCYRPAYYEERKRPKRAGFMTADAYRTALTAWEADMNALDDAAEIIVAKQRQGPANKSATVRFERETARYIDIPDAVPDQQAVGF